MEERKVEVQKKIRESKRKKPVPAAEYKLYVPPHLRSKNESSETARKSISDRTDNAARLAKELGRKHGLTDDQCRMLRLTLERELEARLAI
ncbi:hypothetical protein NECAME_13403 [Necator americanus]|uniref:Uncharacterized protein n=1 Tax=Necator americanus TaxID=51031 RepID=W2SVP9_NECAM|nr:hypothetical protein NECAME_13403 [Necator americanus]ETN73799.1 hypothetical protein NECAME_13403 [Necator americanus]